MKGLKPGLLDRLMDERPDGSRGAPLTSEQLKDSVARDLEALLNTRLPFDPAILKHESFAHLMSLNPDIDPLRIFVGPPDSQMSMIAKLEVEGGRLARVSYLPVQISDGSEPEVVPPSDPRFARISEYVAAISREQGLAAAFRTEGAEIVVDDA